MSSFSSLLQRVESALDVRCTKLPCVQIFVSFKSDSSTAEHPESQIRCRVRSPIPQLLLQSVQSLQSVNCKPNESLIPVWAYNKPEHADHRTGSTVNR